MKLTEEMSRADDVVSSAGVTVLVADDDALFARMLARRLSTLPGVAGVIRASDGAEAVQFGLQRQPEIAVLDVQMPRLGGIDAARTLRDLRPGMEIAMQSADFGEHNERASAFGLRLFDKFDLDRVVEWVEARALAAAPFP